MMASTLLRAQAHQQPATKRHQCPQCWNSYSRRDHLIRHMRSHDGQKPLKCPVCGRHFCRRDLLLRHSRVHQPTSSARHLYKVGKRVVPRVTSACHPCAVAKARCHDQKPCRRCQERGIECTNHPRDTPLEELNGFGVAVATRPTREIPEGNGVKLWMDSLSSRLAGENVGMVDDDDNFENIQQHNPESQLTYLDAGTMSPHYGRSWSRYDDQGPLLTDTTLDESSNTPDEFSSLFFAENTKVRMESVRKVSEMQKMFERSSWDSSCYDGIPLRRSFCGNLTALPASEHAKSPFRNVWPTVPQIFDQRTRDILLAMIVREQRLEEIIPACANFPSATSMNVLADRFLRKQNRKLDCWIHTATFHPSTARMELTFMILAAGALEAQNPELRQWGYQICRFMKRWLVMKLEDGYDHLTALPYLQALLICLEIDSWNCDNFGLFHSGSLPDTMRTCLGRYLRLSQLSHESAAPQHDDEGNELQAKWNKWITSEGYKRLGGRFCTFENQRAAALHVRPSRASSDLCLSLPHPRSLWMARTAQEWKDRYLALYTARAPKVKDLLTSLHARPFPIGFFDETFAIKISAHFLEGLIIDHQLLYRMFKNGAGGNDQQAHPWTKNINAAIQNLQDILQMRYAHSPATNALNNLTVSYLSMILNVCIDDLELLFGKDGAEESQVSSRNMQKWAHTQEAREAICHAGQILRHLRYIERPLSGFIVVIAYQAGLVLLGYLHLRNMTDDATDAIAAEHDMVVLNGAELSTVGSFVQNGMGKLTLQHNFEGSCRTISPITPQLIVQVVKEALFDGTLDVGQATPLLIRGLVQLLRDIANGKMQDGADPRKIRSLLIEEECFSM